MEPQEGRSWKIVATAVRTLLLQTPHAAPLVELAKAIHNSVHSKGRENLAWPLVSEQANGG